MALNHTVKGSVDYTVVGSPTIVDGILSNTTGADYIETASGLSLTTPFELQMRFLKTDTSCRLLNFNNLWMNVYSATNDYVKLEMPANTYSTTISVQNNVWSILRLVSDGSTLILSIKPETSASFTSVSLSIPSSYTTSYSIRFGRHYSSDGSLPANCQIDLNNTYIKINGQEWFGNCPVEVKHIDYGTSVGYTKVGSPTISNGVASNLSGTNHIEINTPFRPGNNTWEIGCKFTTGSSLRDGMIYSFQAGKSFDERYGLSLKTTSDGFFQATFTLDGTSWFNSTTPSYAVSINTTYWTKEYWDGTAFKLDVSTDGITYQNIINIASTTPIYNGFNIGIIGVWNNGYWTYQFLDGSIDFNHTYIKVNGKLWFYKPCTNYLVKDGKLVFADSGLYLSGPNTYTKVGSPTIVDGVASGFSTSNYLQLPVFDFNSASSWEAQILYIVPATSFQAGGILSPSTGNALNIAESPTLGNFLFGLSSNSTTWDIADTNFSVTAAQNDKIKIVVSFQNDTYTAQAFNLTQNITGQQVSISSSSKVYNKALNIGCLRDVIPCKGSIDLNNTYIKANDQLWFYGKNYASQNIAPVSSGYTYGNTTTSAIGWVDMRTQQFTAAPAGATIVRDE